FRCRFEYCHSRHWRHHQQQKLGQICSYCNAVVDDEIDEWMSRNTEYGCCAFVWVFRISIHNVSIRKESSKSQPEHGYNDSARISAHRYPGAIVIPRLLGDGLAIHTLKNKRLNTISDMTI